MRPVPTWCVIADDLRAALQARSVPNEGLDISGAPSRMRPETFLAIAVDDLPVGGVGSMLQGVVERVSAEMGFWLGEVFWGRGITTEALGVLTRYAIERRHLIRLFAAPFAYNTASCRVLEKSGYVLETRLRCRAIKDGRIVDQLQYALIAESR